MKFSFVYQEQTLSIELLLKQAGMDVFSGEQVWTIDQFSKTARQICLTLDGGDQKLYWASHGTNVWLHFQGRTYHLQRSARTEAAGAGSAAGDGLLRAPMPGQVKKQMAKEGQTVNKDDVLLVLEAMKMEIRVLAPLSGRIAKMHVVEGQSVDKEQLLVEIEAEEQQE
jgi:biotin carboxyl carrier protein